MRFFSSSVYHLDLQVNDAAVQWSQMLLKIKTSSFFSLQYKQVYCLLKQQPYYVMDGYAVAFVCTHTRRR